VLARGRRIPLAAQSFSLLVSNSVHFLSGSLELASFPLPFRVHAVTRPSRLFNLFANLVTEVPGGFLPLFELFEAGGVEFTDFNVPGHRADEQ